MKRLRRSLSFANVVSVLALFVALGGSSYAALKVGSKQISNNSVRSKDLRNNDVRGKDIRRGAVTSSDVANRSLLATDFRAGQLPAGRPGTRGTPGTSVFASTIPPGTTIRGVFSVGVSYSSGSTATARAGVSFPVPAPAPLTDATVNFAPAAGDTPPGDGDPACTGSLAAPTAPRGKVCLYHEPGGVGQSNAARGEAVSSESPQQNRYGFIVNYNATGAAVRLDGTWAYTAP